MAEPDNLVLEILKEIRSKIDAVDRKLDAKIDGLERKMDSRFTALEDRVDVLEIKLDGLTHALVSGFGAIVHDLKDLNKRVTLLEAERA
jgi:polyhydroxyalkanoate synthesis regulator phasin